MSMYAYFIIKEEVNFLKVNLLNKSLYENMKLYGIRGKQDDCPSAC